MSLRQPDIALARSNPPAYRARLGLASRGELAAYFGSLDVDGLEAHCEALGLGDALRAHRHEGCRFRFHLSYANALSLALEYGASKRLELAFFGPGPTARSAAFQWARMRAAREGLEPAAIWRWPPESASSAEESLESARPLMCARSRLVELSLATSAPDYDRGGPVPAATTCWAHLETEYRESAWIQLSVQEDEAKVRELVAWARARAALEGVPLIERVEAARTT